uniref:Uncharacterized protein n=1 Tax=Siphoviridae sp. ctnPP24 TaxID=2825662 RepID=A0A8S5TYT9_9CAUD|nr:MAG TPA: hypothetical protein [Siphoviridae sp. ctnPP24]
MLCLCFSENCQKIFLDKPIWAGVKFFDPTSGLRLFKQVYLNALKVETFQSALP